MRPVVSYRTNSAHIELRPQMLLVTNDQVANTLVPQCPGTRSATARPPGARLIPSLGLLGSPGHVVCGSAIIGAKAGRVQDPIIFRQWVAIGPVGVRKATVG